MPGRKYDLLFRDDEETVVKPQPRRDKVKQNGSMISDSELMPGKSYSYVCEVVKSPRAPQYEIHYVKTRKNGLQLVRKKAKIGRKLLDKKLYYGDQQSVSNTEDDETVASVASDTTVQSQDDMVGLRVIACNKQDGLYYPGTVNNTPDSTFAMVTFSDKERQKVRTQMIIPMGGAIARPELAAGDFVLVRVYNQTIKHECYVPGIVEVTPEDFRQHNKFYSVLLYNGQRETTLRRLIVKIGRSRFEMAIRYISHLQQQRLLREKQVFLDDSALKSPQSTSTKKSDDETLSQQSSQSGRGRRKKEKLTQKLKKETEKVGKSKKKSRSRSGSRTNSTVSSRSNSRASSRSRSRSSKASSRSRSSSQSRSRSRSRSRRTNSRRSYRESDSSRSRTPKRSSRMRRRSSSRSSSRSKSRSRSRTPKKSSGRRRASSCSSSNSSWSRSKSRTSKPKSRARSSRSRSRSSSSSSTVKSGTFEKKKHKGKSSRARSRSSSRSSRSRSRGSVKSGGSSTPRAKSPYERPHKPEPITKSKGTVRRDIYYERNSRSTDFTQSESRMTDASCFVNIDEKDEMIQTLQHQLEKQKRKQLRQETRLVRQARKINKIQRKMRSTDTSHNDSTNSSQTEKSDREKSVQLYYSDTETSPRRRNGSPDEPVDRVNVGRSMSDSIMEQEVLARWTDDGWYYTGYVIGEKGDQQYIVRDNTGYMEIIDREDILTNIEHRFKAIQPEDYVIGLHPKYVFSYAPAEVMNTFSNNCVKVEFFDGNLAELTADDVYKISKTKYDAVVEYIKKCEKHMVGKSVVAREDNTGVYKLGVIDSRVGLGQQFYIKWLDGDMSKQNSNHIFEVGKPQTNHEQWYYVLAPTSHNNATYMPAEIIQSNPLVFNFCDGRRTAEVTMDQCFWISKEYYINARAFFLDIKQGR